jgi:hypothetical protein
MPFVLVRLLVAIATNFRTGSGGCAQNRDMTTKTWGEFAEAAPQMATAGRDLLYQFGPGLAFLATVRSDGGPRLHPVCPVVVDNGLYVFVGNQTPKVADLQRDGRYALHTFPPVHVDDEFYVTGTVRVVDDPALRQHVLDVYLAQGTTTQNDTLFELLFDHAMHAKYEGRPSWSPAYTHWHAG